jgi:hypothetical protein
MAGLEGRSSTGDQDVSDDAELTQAKAELIQARKEAVRLATILAEGNQRLQKRRLAKLKEMENALDEEDASRGMGSSALLQLSHGESISPQGKVSDGKTIQDDDGRTILIVNKNTLGDRLRASYAYKRMCDKERYQQTMSSDLTVVESKLVLQVTIAKSFSRAMIEEYATLMEHTQDGTAIPPGLDTWATSVLYTKLQQMRVVTNPDLFGRAIQFGFMFLDHANLCLMHYDVETNEEKFDLQADLSSLSKDKLIRCLLHLEIVNTCFLSRAWINCTLVFRNRIEYGDLYMANRLLVRNAVELVLCTLGGELSWPMLNPDTTKGGFLKVTEPAIVVRIFKDRLAKITQGTPDELSNYTETLVPMLMSRMSSSDMSPKKVGNGLDEKQGKGNNKVAGGGAAGKTKRGIDGEQEGLKVVKSEEHCSSHLGYLLGVFSRECKFDDCSFSHKGVSDVPKDVALAALALKKLPEKLAEAFRKACEEKLT